MQFNKLPNDFFVSALRDALKGEAEAAMPSAAHQYRLFVVFINKIIVCLLLVFMLPQDALKAEAEAALGKDYVEDASYQEATKTSFADLFKKVRFLAHSCCITAGSMCKGRALYIARAWAACVRMWTCLLMQGCAGLLL
jgi:hypothetical protein